MVANSTTMLRPVEASPPVLNESWQQVLQARWTKVINKWLSVQLTRYGGKYSIERMLALQEFTENASLICVAMLTLAPPILTIAVVLSQESVPLQDPTEGWEANYGFWFRVGFASLTMGYVIGSQVGPWLDVPSLTSRQMVVFVSSYGVCFIAAGMVVAEIWVFPIPFFLLLLSTVLTGILVVLLRLVVGANAFQEILSRREQLRRLNNVASLQMVMCTAYPAFQVLFNKVNHTKYELPILLLLPVFKFIMRSAFAFAASDRDDIVPEQVVFTVDFFDALYRATCTQALSTTSLVVIVAVDLVNTAIELQELHQRAQSVLARLRVAAGITNNGDSSDILSALRSLCYRPEALRSHKHAGIRARSYIFHQLSGEGMALLDTLDDFSGPSGRFARRSFNMTRVSPHTMTNSRHGAVVRSPAPILVASNHPRPKELSANNSHVLKEALEVLFTTECLILTEYMEVIVPIIYGSFVLAMAQLPSAQYHTEMVGVTRENVGGMVSKVFVYALLEVVSFIFLAVFMRRNCGLNPIRQLAFVLKTQMPYVLSKLMLWLMFTLSYRVIHFGSDLSFRFEWIGH